MQTFLRRLEILNFLSARQHAHLEPASTEQIIQHLQDGGYVDARPENPRSQFRLIQRDLQFLLGERDDYGEHDNDFGLAQSRGQAKSSLWSLEPYQQLSYDFERMPAYMALALSLSQKHLKQVLPSATQRELAQVFSSAQSRLQQSERKLAAQHYSKLTSSVEFYQRGQSLRTPDFDMQWLDKIYQAILLGRRIEIGYQRGAKLKHYQLDPYGIAIMLPKLYLVAAKVDDAQEEPSFRHFLLHKIQSVEISRFANKVPEDFVLKDYLEAGHMDLLIDNSDQQDYTLVLDLYVEAQSTLLVDLQDSPIAADQKLSEQTEGHWQLRATVKRTVQLRNWLLALGDQAKLREPAIIVDDLITQLKQQLANYQG